MPAVELPTPGTTFQAKAPAEPDLPPVLEPQNGGAVVQVQDDAPAYRQAIFAQLLSARRYPRREALRGVEGSGRVLFHIDRNERLISVSLTQSTGSSALDEAALALVRRAAPFPPIPANLPDELELGLPVDFLLVSPGMAAR